MKSVLLIAFHFPPEVSVGAVRPANFTRYLANHGWKPVIVTVNQRAEGSRGGSSFEDDRSVVLRTRMVRNPSAWHRSLKAWVYSLMGRKNKFHENVLSWTPQGAPQQSRESVPAFLKRIALSMLHTPDEVQGWLPFAVIASLRAIRKHQIRCIVSTGPPFTAHLVAFLAKAISGVSWVADFRDPWFDNQRPGMPQKDSVLKSRPANALNGWLESAVMRAADRVVCVTPAMTEECRRRYPDLPGEKWVTITNGFDAEEFRRLGPIARAPKFTLSYVGNMIYARSPETLLRAIGELVAEGELDRQSIAVQFIGFCRYAAGRSVEEMIAAHGLSDVARVRDTIPRQEALREMMQSQVLLLLANEQQLCVPGKTYEYLATGAHILALTERGATADLISQIPGTAVREIADLSGIKEVIRGWYLEFERHGSRYGDEPWNTAVVRKFEWNDLGQNYARVLEECMAGVGESRTIAPEWDKKSLASELRD